MALLALRLTHPGWVWVRSPWPPATVGSVPGCVRGPRGARGRLWHAGRQTPRASDTRHCAPRARAKRRERGATSHEGSVVRVSHPSEPRTSVRRYHP
eukprot:scaffold111755_cov63-Phaeocystis_antarctica.AAC.1